MTKGKSIKPEFWYFDEMRYGILADDEGKKEKEMRKRRTHEWDEERMAGFCLQVSLFLQAGISLSDGLESMAQEAEEDQEMLGRLFRGVKSGALFSDVLEKEGIFPSLVTAMVKNGQENGELKQRLGQLAAFYKREAKRKRQIVDGWIASGGMAASFLIVLFILFTQVLPVFEPVYVQMGMRMPRIFQVVSLAGGIVCGGGLVCGGMAVVILSASQGSLAEPVRRWARRKSKIWRAESGRRFALVLAMALKNCLELEASVWLAWEAGGFQGIPGDLKTCIQRIQKEAGSLDGIGEEGRFGRYHLLMIQGGMHSGPLDGIMEEIAKDYEQQAERLRTQLLVWIEPILGGIFVGGTGFVLLCVMFPLAGVVAGMG